MSKFIFYLQFYTRVSIINFQISHLDEISEINFKEFITASCPIFPFLPTTYVLAFFLKTQDVAKIAYISNLIKIWSNAAKKKTYFQKPLLCPQNAYIRKKFEINPKNHSFDLKIIYPQKIRHQYLYLSRNFLYTYIEFMRESKMNSRSLSSLSATHRAFVLFQWNLNYSVRRESIGISETVNIKQLVKEVK